jgi:hypothetical protein
LKIRFQADADLHLPIVTGVKRIEPTIDFNTARQTGLFGLDDQSVLALAAQENRILVSHDVTTMPENFAHFIEARTSPGVILITQQMSYRDAIEGLLYLYYETEAEHWQNLISFLPKIRK